MSNFCEIGSAMAPGSADGKNFRLLKYEHIFYKFEACGLEISNIYNYFREIFKFRENMGKNRFREIS